ncbi:MAG TPA: HlyD family efflux transporter periplasmic adaptor subunit [Burkholderiaceae bacterium]|nr:HlyD family efflux transporter periplasmic adaptor subunit [Burkholderiaceae bacterium]
MSLFRKEALEARQTPWLGDIVLVRPVSFSIVVAVAVAAAVAVLLFLVLGTYTARETVSGQLVPDSGVITLRAPRAGVVVERRVRKGQKVKAGDVLYVVSTDTRSQLGSTQAAISAQVGRREASLRAEQQRTRQLHKSERTSLVTKISALAAELQTLDAQIKGQRARLALARQSVDRYRKLVAQGYVSREQLEARQQDALDQGNQLQSLQRDRIRMSEQLSAQRADLAELALKQQNEAARFERDLTNAAEALSESEAKRRELITAPVTGSVAAVLADPGQAIGGDRPLATIVPAGSKLVALLYAPSKAVGFVRPGDRVQIRYQAYPYQTYGQQPGTVLSVAHTALSASELRGGAVSGQSDTESLFLIRVRLASQTDSARGQALALLPGMALEADIMLQKRRLYQWALKPLYSLSDGF